MVGLGSFPDISCTTLYGLVILTAYLAFAYAFLCPSLGLTNSYATIETQIKYHLLWAAFSDSSRQYQPLFSEVFQPHVRYLYFAMTHPVTQ